MTLQKTIKDRPEKFSDMVLLGDTKERIKSVIKNKDRAILLYGETGCGKTTLANLLAKKLTDSEIRDITRLDFRTENGIDTVRELISNSQYLPIKFHKVYILEEFQGATKQAQESFLNAIDFPLHDKITFIFTTNQVNKLVKPLVDRCTKIPLETPSFETLNEYLIAKGYSEKIAKQAAQGGLGSFRSSLQIAEDLMSGGNSFSSGELIDQGYKSKVLAWADCVNKNTMESFSKFAKLNDNYFMAIKNITQITNDYLAFMSGKTENFYSQKLFETIKIKDIKIVLALAKNSVRAYDEARLNGEMFCSRYYSMFIKGE